MIKSKVVEVTKYLQQCLKETGLDISKIILFGSQSKEEATEESDIDIAIISKDFIGKDIFERAHMTRDAEINTRTKSSLRSDFLEYIKLYLIYYKKIYVTS